MAFRARAGQWVLLDNKTLGIHVTPDHGSFKTVGEVIVGFPPAGQLITTVGDPKKCQIDIVAEDGCAIKAHLLIDTSRLTPVTKREQIPAPRLKTCDPKWVPRP